jgi:glycosyltransferase involved in cell wall biosynthesis
VVPNGITLTESSESPASEGQVQEKVLLYIGALGYGPNIDAIEYFVKNIFPLILKNEPNVQLWIAGNTQWAPNHIFELTKNPSIRVLGFVEDLRQLYAKANVFVVPIRLGGGTRIKILEAASFKKAIVSTQIGCEGLDFAHGEGIWIADDPATFSKACLELLNNRNKNLLMGQCARKVVEEKYQWSTIEKNLIKLFSKDLS